jgi:hypothetical protein
MVGDQVLEATVTKPEGSWGAAFVPEVFLVPIAPPADAPLPEARRRPNPARQTDRAGVVARNDELFLDLLFSDAIRLLDAADAPVRRDDLAAKLGLEHDRLALAKVIYRLRVKGHHVAP